MEQTENPGRERILARIRAALRKPAPMHVASGASRSVFAPVTDALARFEKECSENHTECIVTPDMHAAGAAVASVLASLPAGEIFVQDAPVLRRMAPLWPQDSKLHWSHAALSGGEGPAESSQATITLAESLVAQTGSVFVSAACGGRGASVVAPVHIVVASVEQLVPDLDAAFAHLIERGAPAQNSFLCLITGSSRTSDIEKIMVLGAHGPRRLVVVLSLRPE
ncbi:MAG: LutC/YkgG family protein [Candidatus Acidiferrales bacterium]